MNNELSTVSANDMTNKFMPQKQSSFDARTIKWGKKSRKAKYNVGFKGDFVDLPTPFKGVIIGAYKKYELSDFKDKEVVYNYQTTEFAYADHTELVTILDRKKGIELGRCRACDLDEWCINHQKKTQSITPSFVQEVENKYKRSPDEPDTKIVKNFKAKQILYIADKEKNIYRLEVSGDYQTVNKVFDAMGDAGYANHQAIVEFGFEEEEISVGSNNFYPSKFNFVRGIDDLEMTQEFFSMQLEVYKAIKALQANMHAKALEENRIEYETEDTTMNEVLEAPKKEVKEEKEEVKCPEGESFDDVVIEEDYSKDPFEDKKETVKAEPKTAPKDDIVAQAKNLFE